MKKNFKSASGFKKNWLAVIFLIFLQTGIVSASNVAVTFRVNMSKAYPPNGVYIGSDWAGWSFEKFQKLLDTNQDSIFELTVYLPAGESYNYRYTTSNADWGHFESLAGTMCGFGPNHEDRNILVPQSNKVLEIVCFNSCLNCGSTQMSKLNLSVDMSGLAVSPNGVHVTGTFNNWAPGSLEMKDENNDNIYDISVPLIPNLDYEYKFLNGNTLNDAEVVFGTCEFRAKRRVSVVGDTMTMPVVKFGSCNSTGTPITDIKVACVGNSITEGGAGNFFNSWPLQLRDLLGSGYYTENLGVSGTTMSKSGDSPWWNQPQYNYTFGLVPDIVVIKLGTNDSKSGNWKPVNYKADYIDLIEKLRAMPSQPEIYMVTPAKAYSSLWNINDNVIVMQIIPILHQIAFEKAVHLIDMYNTTSNMPANFPDGIHPNSAGAKVIAQKAKENMQRAKPIIMQVDPVTDTTANSLYQWFYNGEQIPGSNFRAINATKEGKYSVAVKMSSASSDIYVSEPIQVVLPQGVSSVGLTTDYEVVYEVNSIFGSQNVRIYPNPASSAITIENAEDADVSIFSGSGNLVLTRKKIDKIQAIDMHTVENGTYLVRLSRNNATYTQRIVILAE